MLPSVRLLRQATRIVRYQQNRIVELEREVLAAELQYMRISRDLMEQFLIALDCPENHDVFRDRLTEALGFYRDEIAVREEHA